MERIIGYKLQLMDYKSPQEMLDDYVKVFNNLEFNPAIEQTFKQMEYYEQHINEILNRYPELQEPFLKKFTWQYDSN